MLWYKIAIYYTFDMKQAWNDEGFNHSHREKKCILQIVRIMNDWMLVHQSKHQLHVNYELHYDKPVRFPSKLLSTFDQNRFANEQRISQGFHSILWWILTTVYAYKLHSSGITTQWLAYCLQLGQWSTLLANSWIIDQTSSTIWHLHCLSSSFIFTADTLSIMSRPHFFQGACSPLMMSDNALPLSLSVK